MAETTKQTIEIDKSKMDKIRQMAAEMGYTIGRGPFSAWGSLPQLIEAIADGDVKICKAGDKKDA